jgi:pimeloyl-ACP methyl ester carboxylesterase
MPKPASKKTHKHLRLSDLRGLAQLATQATAGVTNVAEGVHQSIWNTLGFSGGTEPGRTGGITGLVYKGVHGVTRLVGGGVDAALGGLESVFSSANDDTTENPKREAILAALNGVMGDRLMADESPFAIPMTFRLKGQVMDLNNPPPGAEVTGKILVLIHGLCMNDRQWRTTRDGRVVDHGEDLAAALGCSPISVRYNSGLHISDNGRDLSAKLEQLVTRWPVPVEELSVVAHSMGGLLIRSAHHAATQEKLRWPDTLKNIVFLGTPHQGAPLEQAGNWVDTILASTPYTAPFAKLGHLRSPGITDLRYGSLVAEDRQDCDRFEQAPDLREVVPLPEGVACFAVAATTASEPGFLANRMIGDGLVPVDSALGRHDEERRDLGLSAEATKIEYRTNHLGLLSSPDVTHQMVRWLTSDPT